MSNSENIDDKARILSELLSFCQIDGVATPFNARAKRYARNSVRKVNHPNAALKMDASFKNAFQRTKKK